MNIFHLLLKKLLEYNIIGKSYSTSADEDIDGKTIQTLCYSSTISTLYVLNFEDGALANRNLKPEESLIYLEK